MIELATVSLLKFKIPRLRCAVDAQLVQEIVPLASDTPPISFIDLADRLGIYTEKKAYRKLIILQSVCGQSVPVGVLAEEIEGIEDFPQTALRRLPTLVAANTKSPLPIGFLLAEESFYLLIDGEALADAQEP